jgi:hypothetical protein
MQLHTTRSQIRGVAKAWREQYGTDKADIAKRLDALGPDASAKEVENIIGNNTWTELNCDECGRDMSAVVRIGDPSDDDYERRDVDLCEECLRKALDLISPPPSR